MSTAVPSTRRLAIAIGTAATAATVAIGVTAASLLGWFTPSTGQVAPETSAPTPASAPVILVPITPTAAPPDPSPRGDVQLAMEHGDRGRSADERKHEHDDHEREEDHDDD